MCGLQEGGIFIRSISPELNFRTPRSGVKFRLAESVKGKTCVEKKCLGLEGGKYDTSRAIHWSQGPGIKKVKIRPVDGQVVMDGDERGASMRTCRPPSCIMSSNVKLWGKVGEGGRLEQKPQQGKKVRRKDLVDNVPG